MKEYGPKLGILFVISVILIAVPMYLFSAEKKTDYSITKDDIQLEVNDDGTIEITENLNVNPHTTISFITKDLFPISSLENKRYNCYDCVREVNAYVDGVETSAEAMNEKREETNTRVITFDPTSRKFAIRLNYTIDSRAMKRYTSIAAFGFNMTPYETNSIDNIKVTVKVPKKGANKFYVKDTTTGSSIHVKKINSTTYTMSQDKLTGKEKTNFIISVDTNLLEGTTILKEKAGNDVLNFNYDEKTRARLDFEKKNKNIFPLVYFIVFSFVIYLFLRVMRYRRNHVKHIKDDLVIPYRNPDMDLTPGLASKLISGKSKDFALSLILELQARGNIALRTDGSIMYLKDTDLTDYEHQFLKVLFQRKELKNGFVITIPRLKEFVKSTEERQDNFKQDFGLVRDLATESLYKKNIYDKSLGAFMNAFEKYGFVNMIGAMIFMVGYLLGFYDPVKESIVGIVMTLFIVSIIILILPIDLHTIWKYLDKRVKKWIRVGYLLLQLVLLVPVIGYALSTKELYLVFVLIFAVLNFLLFRFYEEELFTDYGRLEYLKLSGLRHFLVHYHESEIESFEQTTYYKYYLRYAVAFGIIDKVLPHQTGVLKVLGEQLKELFDE